MELLEVRGTNFCCFNDIKLPLKNMGLVWVGGKNNDTKAAGNNGSGKSTIFKLLTWTLFGQTVDKEKGDKVIRKGAKVAIGEVDLGDGGEVWTVRRTRKKGAPNLSIVQPNGEEFKAGKDVIQEKVFEMVGGLDFLAFKNTVLYGQNDIESRFSNPKTKDTERKDMLHKILRTGILKHCHKYVSKQRLETKRRLAEKATSIRTLEARLDEIDLDGVKERSDEFDAETLEMVREESLCAKKYKKQAKEKRASINLVIPPDPSIKKKETKRVKEFRTEQLRLTAMLEKLEEEDHYQVLLHEARAEHREQQRIFFEIQSGIKQYEKELGRLSGSKCSVCKSSLSQGEAKRYIKNTRLKLNKEKVKGENKKNGVLKALETITTLEKKLGKIHSLKSELSTVELNLSEAKSAVSIWNIQNNSVKANKEMLEAEAKALDEQVKSTEERALQINTRVNPFNKMYKEAKKKGKTYKKLIKGQRVETKKMDNELAHLEFWVKGFSNQGLPSFIMDGVMPFITERANHYLETLSDGDIVVEFSTQREMKSKKEFRDEIDISWTIEGVEGSYPPSGGQMKKIEIATDFALMDLVAAREGGGVDLLALDEVLDGLDEEGRQRVILLLREIRAKRGTVFVISHDPDVSEVFEKAVIVTKTKGNSSLALVS